MTGRSKVDPGFYRRVGKRGLDLALAVPLLVVAAPLIGLVALAVRLGLGSPVLYRQVRPGLGGQPFTLLKFRTLSDATDADGRPLPDLERSTPLGRWLRRWSLDELPGLWNVLRGDMSLVGPRPLLMEYLDRYTADEARRHEVRPGLTGWAQIHGRNLTSWRERLERDRWYVDHLGPGLDLRILLATPRELLRSDGGLEQGRRLGKFRGGVAGGGGEPGR